MSKRVTEVEQYWLKRGKHFFYERRPKYVWTVIKTLMSFLKTLSFETVFELGCGYGGITKLILQQFPNVKIQAVDISPDQIRFARKYVGSDRVEFDVGTIHDFDVSENKYDLVIAVFVLTYIPFHDIEKVVMKMVKMSKKSIVNADWYMSIPDYSGHIFQQLPHPRYGMSLQCVHDYTSLYKKFGVKEVRMILIPRYPVYGISFGLDSGFQVFRRKEEMHGIWFAKKQ